MLRGSCLCGAVGYEVEDAFAAAFYCHCSKCRRATGSAFKPMASIPFDRIRLVRGRATSCSTARHRAAGIFTAANAGRCFIRTSRTTETATSPWAL